MLKKFKFVIVLALGLLIAGCTNSKVSSSGNDTSTVKTYESLTDSQRQQIKFYFDAEAKITNNNNQSNPPKAAVSAKISNQGTTDVQIDLAHFRLKGVEANPHKTEVVEVKAGKSVPVADLFASVPVSYFSQPVSVDYFAGKYQVGEIKALSNQAQLNKWLAQVASENSSANATSSSSTVVSESQSSSSSAASSSSTTSSSSSSKTENTTVTPSEDQVKVGSQTYTKVQINQWIVNVLNQTNKIPMTTADYLFEYYDTGVDGAVKIAVVENHRTQNMQDAGGDPNTMPTIARLQLTNDGKLNNIITGQVFSDGYVG